MTEGTRLTTRTVPVEAATTIVDAALRYVTLRNTRAPQAHLDPLIAAAFERAVAIAWEDLVRACEGLLEQVYLYPDDRRHIEVLVGPDERRASGNTRDADAVGPPATVDV